MPLLSRLWNRSCLCCCRNWDALIHDRTVDAGALIRRLLRQHPPVGLVWPPVGYPLAAWGLMAEGTPASPGTGLEAAVLIVFTAGGLSFPRRGSNSSWEPRWVGPRQKPAEGSGPGHHGAIPAGVAIELQVDANGGWTQEQAKRMLESLAFKVVLLEQPLLLIWIRRGTRQASAAASALSDALVADESRWDLEDLLRLAPVVDGVNCF